MKLENLKEEAAERKHNYDTIEKIRKEIQAVSIAEAKIKEAAGNLQKLTGQKLQDEISEIFAQITGGKYKRVLLTENFEIYLDTGEKYLQLYQVSYGTAEQVIWRFGWHALQSYVRRRSFLLSLMKPLPCMTKNA